MDSPRGALPTLLLVDDHEELLELVERSLGREGYEIITAATASAATEIVSSTAVHLMVLDLGLPDGSGLELCRRLRRAGRQMPILVLTARGAVASRVECLDAGADDYLTKPFAVAELEARVRALLRRAPISTLDTFRRDDVELSFATRTARVAGETAPITAREWAILETLAAAGGQLVSRERLLERGWPDASSSRSASLEVLISRIRRKLGGDLIRTLRGQGYALAAGDPR